MEAFDSRASARRESPAVTLSSARPKPSGAPARSEPGATPSTSATLRRVLGCGTVAPVSHADTAAPPCTPTSTESLCWDQPLARRSSRSRAASMGTRAYPFPAPSRLPPVDSSWERHIAIQAHAPEGHAPPSTPTALLHALVRALVPRPAAHLRPGAARHPPKGAGRLQPDSDSISSACTAQTATPVPPHQNAAPRSRPGMHRTTTGTLSGFSIRIGDSSGGLGCLVLCRDAGGAASRCSRSRDPTSLRSGMPQTSCHLERSQPGPAGASVGGAPDVGRSGRPPSRTGRTAARGARSALPAPGAEFHSWRRHRGLRPSTTSSPTAPILATYPRTRPYWLGGTATTAGTVGKPK